MSDSNKHFYLLKLYGDINQEIESGDFDLERLPSIVVNFCIVIEKILKIKLYNKSPFFVYDHSRFKDDDQISMVALGEKLNIETIRIESVLKRFSIVFSDTFSTEEIQALNDLYRLRNHFIHSHMDDTYIEYEEDDVIKKMGPEYIRARKGVITQVRS